MPELPEVTTTVNGLNEILPKLSIRDVWSDYHLRTKNKRTDTIKNKKYFERFRKEIVGEKVKSAERRGKNVLIHLTHNKTILIHMKMTGHLLYGKYIWKETVWMSQEKFLSDPFNKFIHLIFTLSNGKRLAFSDMRKFARITIENTKGLLQSADLKHIGPDPLSRDFNLKEFTSRLKNRRSGKIKQ